MFKGSGTDYSKDVIRNDGFWPDITVADFEERRTIPADIDKISVSDFLVDAIVKTNSALADYAAMQKAKGINSASLVACDVSVNGDNQLVVQYRKAVYARAKADLIGEYASLGRRESHTGQDNPDTAAKLLAEAAFTIRSIKGLKRVGVSVG